MNDLIFYGIALAVAGYVFWVWLVDLRAYYQGARAEAYLLANSSMPADAKDKLGRPSSPYAVHSNAPPPVFPGAVPASATAISVAIVGAIGLLAVEVIGENRLGIAGEQSNMTVLFGLYTLAAAFIEELIFRGYLFYDKGTRAQLVGSIILVSLLFAMLHPYMWKWTMPSDLPDWQVWHGRLSVDLGTKALWSTSIVFVRSLWFYCVRFWPANRLRSLIPCIAAHLATNLGVFGIKAVQGHVTWY